MKINLVHDKVTDVGFIDIATAPEGASIRVFDVTDEVGLKSQVHARVDVTNGVFLGVIVENYPAFRREVRRKYVALRVEAIISLILGKLKASLSNQYQKERHLELAAH
jgi:hypothetical protein